MTWYDTKKGRNKFLKNCELIEAAFERIDKKFGSQKSPVSIGEKSGGHS